MATPHPLDRTPTYEKGLRLMCEACGSEVEIVNPTTSDPPRQVFRCCGQEMIPSPGRAVNLGVE